MANAILVKNLPYVDQLIESKLCRSLGLLKGQQILEDYKGQKAMCSIDEHGRLEYVNDYMNYNATTFVSDLQQELNLYWIELTDLIDYNQNVIRQKIPYQEFQDKVELMKQKHEFVAINLENSEYLWNRMTPLQKARVLPLGYMQNYLRSVQQKGLPRFDVVVYLQRSINGQLSFGIYKEK